MIRRRSLRRGSARHRQELLDCLEGRMRNFTRMNRQGNFDWSDFSPHLFWDVDRSSLKLPEHGVYVLAQVVDFGLQKDWNLLKSLVREEQLKLWAQQAPSLDPVSVSFLAQFLQIDRSTFRCFSEKPSATNFWES
jgi:hypothetical protein